MSLYAICQKLVFLKSLVDHWSNPLPVFTRSDLLELICFQTNFYRIVSSTS